MTYNKALIAVFLGLLSILPAIGSESVPTPRERIGNIVEYGCKGTLCGPVVYGIFKSGHSGIRFSKEDLEPMAWSCLVGLCGGVVYGAFNEFENRPRKPLLPIQSKIQTNFPKINSQFDSLEINQNKRRTIIE